MAGLLNPRMRSDVRNNSFGDYAGGLLSSAGNSVKDWYTGMHPMDQAAVATAPIPILGDITGAAADARMFYEEPESRTWANAGMSAAGLLPFVPALSVGRKAVAELGQKASNKPGRVVNRTKANDGYTVHALSGETPTEGLMMGVYPNDSKRNTVLDGLLKRGDVEDFYKKNNTQLRSSDKYMGTWQDTGTNKTYLDVSQRFDPDNIRGATKTGEKTGQLAGFNMGSFEEFPVGNWREFVNSPEYKTRMDDMAKKGREYLAQHPTKEWWDIHGTQLEETYGKENLEQVAGYIATTAPNTNPTQNMRMMSEYMRRHLAGEPIIQPDFRIPDDAVARTPGVQLGMEAGRHHNLKQAEAGNLMGLRSDKVREEGQALFGNPDAVVLDRWHARGAEKPSAGVFTNTSDGTYPGSIKKDTPFTAANPYEEHKRVMSEAARANNQAPRDFSADVWTGIREEVKNTGELFGEKFNAGAVQGESKAYADIFSDLVKEKAEHLGISVAEMKARLGKGKGELLGLLGAAGLSGALYSGEDPNAI